MSAILEVGCGMKKPEGRFGIDKNPRSAADLVHDLNETPWPVDDDVFTEVHCHAVLEHLDDFYGVMEEIWRVSQDGALVYADVPHYTDHAAYADPTHVNYLTSYSFDTLTGETEWSFYTDVRFDIVSLEVRLLGLYRLLLIEAIINLSIRRRSLRFVRKFWEHYLSFIIRGKTIEVVLRVRK